MIYKGRKRLWQRQRAERHKRKKADWQSDVLVYIYALTAIAISVIGCLKIGFVGGLLTSVLQYLIGTLYGVFYGVVIGISLMAIFRRSWKQSPAKYIVAIILFFERMADPSFASRRMNS